MRKFIPIEISNLISFKEKLLSWASSYSVFSVLDSNGWSGNENELIIAVGVLDEMSPSENSFEELKTLHDKKNDWLFGFLSYDLKNEVENLSSKNFDGVGFPHMHFFQPKYVFLVKGNKLNIGFLPEVSSKKEIENLLQEINNHNSIAEHPLPGLKINSRISEEEYIHTTNKIIEHIRKGDIYEMNYCMEFFAKEVHINPGEIFQRLNKTSLAPFSSFYRINNRYLMCASPERFLKKSREKIISQPIKGTARRGKNVSEDVQLKQMLSQNKKEKSENVMIVDLVRNDLSKTCDNVTVDELCSISTFKQWHQMISTVSGRIRKGVHFTDVIKNAFPMGSMTGAPKVKAMELIEYYEKTKRGLYSGAVGYITPDGDFDFNVVIRSILYNQTSAYLSFQVGSAITANSIPENEYKECFLKANGMFEALSVPHPEPRKKELTLH